MAEIQVVKAGEAALMLANELGLERALAVAGNVDAQGADVGQHGLGALAVAVIGCDPFGLGLTRRVAQVVAHLGTQRALKNRFLELLEDTFEFGWRYRPWDELLKRCG